METKVSTDDLYALKDIDLYRVLCMTKEEYTPELVKKKYRKLVVKYHPDKNKNDPGANDRFQLLHLAYDILSNDQKKAMYDRVYTENMEAEDYTQLKGYNRDNYEGTTISNEEFAARVERMNRNIDPEFGNNKGKLTDQQAQDLMRNNRQEDCLSEDMKKQFEEDLQALNNIKDNEERMKKFNEMFDTRAQDVDEDVQDLMLYNGNTNLYNSMIASTNNYDTMFADDNTYESAFKIQSSHLHEELDKRSFEEQMRDYEAQTEALEAMAKRSTLKDGQADFGSSAL